VPTITWLKNDTDLPSDSRYSISTSGALYIHGNVATHPLQRIIGELAGLHLDLKREDSALYSCRAVNEDGEDRWIAALIVEGRRKNQSPWSCPLVSWFRPDNAERALPTNARAVDVPVGAGPASAVERQRHERHARVGGSGAAGRLGRRPVSAQLLFAGRGRSLAPRRRPAGAQRRRADHRAPVAPRRRLHLRGARRQPAGLERPQPAVGGAAHAAAKYCTRATGRLAARSTQRSATDADAEVSAARRRLLNESLVKLRELRPVNATAVQLTWAVLRADVPLSGFSVRWRRQQRQGDAHGLLNVTARDARQALVAALRPFTSYEFFVRPYFRTVEGLPSNILDVTTDEAGESSDAARPAPPFTAAGLCSAELAADRRASAHDEPHHAAHLVAPAASGRHQRNTEG